MTREEFIRKWGSGRNPKSLLPFFIADLDELLKQEAISVFRHVHRFGSQSEKDIDQLYQQHKNHNNEIG